MKKCSQCSREAEAGKSRCRPCLDRAAERKRDRAAAGVCRACSEPAAAGRRLCPEHLAEQAARRAADYQQRKATGRCVMSGCGRKPLKGHVYCRPCLTRINSESNASRKGRVVAS